MLDKVGKNLEVLRDQAVAWAGEMVTITKRLWIAIAQLDVLEVLHIMPWAYIEETIHQLRRWWTYAIGVWLVWWAFTAFAPPQWQSYVREMVGGESHPVPESATHPTGQPDQCSQPAGQT